MSRMAKFFHRDHALAQHLGDRDRRPVELLARAPEARHRVDQRLHAALGGIKPCGFELHEGLGQRGNLERGVLGQVRDELEVTLAVGVAAGFSRGGAQAIEQNLQTLQLTGAAKDGHRQPDEGVVDIHQGEPEVAQRDDQVAEGRTQTELGLFKAANRTGSASQRALKLTQKLTGILDADLHVSVIELQLNDDVSCVHRLFLF
jgi:hypothetical protein